MTPTRAARIHSALEWCQQKAILRSYYCAGGEGRRWVLEGVGFTSRVFSTREVEAFILGASEGRTTGLLDAPTPNCDRCGEPWEAHYDPERLKYKNGPFGTFGLVADHTPHLPGVHATRESTAGAL